MLQIKNEKEKGGRDGGGGGKIGKLLCLLLCLHAPSSLRRSAKCQENERRVLYTIKN